MSQSQTTQSLLMDYKKRLREDMRSLRDNFQAIVEAARCQEKSQLGKTTAAIYDKCQIQVRGSNIVRAGENLMKLISDLKTFLVIHDFPAINESIEKRTVELIKSTKEMKENLLKIREELGEHLVPGEDEYYSSLRPYDQGNEVQPQQNQQLGYSSSDQHMMM